MMNQCEALMTGKQQKMSVLRSFKPEATKAIAFSEDDEKEEVFLLKEVRERESVFSVLLTLIVLSSTLNLVFVFFSLLLRVLQTEEADEDDHKALTVAPVQPQGQLPSCSHGVEQNSFRLPSSSPYDEFLKAAGC